MDLSGWEVGRNLEEWRTENHDQNIVYKNVFSIKKIVCFVNRFSNLAVETTE